MIKVPLKKGYIGGRFFGLFWSGPFLGAALMSGYQNLNTYPFSQSEALWFDVAFSLLFYTELAGPMLGVLAGVFGHLLETLRKRADEHHSGFLNLVAWGIIFWILGSPVSTMTRTIPNVILLSDFWMSLLVAYGQPLLAILFSASIRYEWQFDTPKQTHVMAHTILRWVVSFLVVVVFFWLYVNLTVRGYGIGRSIVDSMVLVPIIGLATALGAVLVISAIAALGKVNLLSYPF